MKVSLFEVRECFSELVASAMDIGLYRTEREIENLGNLLVGTPLDVPQQNAGAVFGSKGADGCFDGTAQLLSLDGVEGRFLARSDLQRARSSVLVK